MKAYWLIVASLAIFLGVDAYDEDNLFWEKKWTEIELRYHTDEEFRQLVDKQARDWPPDDILPISPFDCDVSLGISDEDPTSVHELRPGDIDVIASFGDSITAGNGLGAHTVLHVALENRGESWSVGDDFEIEDNIITIPNILEKFNPDLEGASTCVATRDIELRSRFNVAEPGATNRGMQNQAHYMVEMMKKDAYVDYENDWKLVTLMIGGNDLCRVCNNNSSYGPDAYREGVERALDVLHEEMPRTLVNLVPFFDVSPLTNMSRDGNFFDVPISFPSLCDILHRAFCSCAVEEESRAELKGIQMNYYYLLEELVESGKYDDKDDFTVVLQPHMRDLEPILNEDGEWDNSFLSHDCFHPNRLGHQGLAYMLWNVMLTPVQNKPVKYPESELEAALELGCPTEDCPYIFTGENSEGMDHCSGLADGRRRHRKEPKHKHRNRTKF